MRRPRYDFLGDESVGGQWRVHAVGPSYALVFLVRSFPARLRSTSRSERWSLANAVAVLLAAMGALWLRSLGPLLLVGLAMLGLLGATHRGRWTPSGAFGTANLVTAGRAALLAAMPLAATTSPWALIGLSLLVLGLDGVDGWLARHHGQSSEFGAFFDKETDALFLLLLCGLAVVRGPLPAWVLGAGLLRYGFVVAIFLLPTRQKTEVRSTAARYVYGGMMTALLASFLLPPAAAVPLAALASAALLVSFGRSLWGIVAAGRA